MKYRKKPVVIEAFQYDGDFIYSDGTPYEAPEWIFKALEDGTMYFKGQGELLIKTLEGDHHASVGDFIIQGVQGELYPCKPDIFEMTYEPVDKAEKNNCEQIDRIEGLKKFYRQYCQLGPCPTNPTEEECLKWALSHKEGMNELAN